MATVKKANVPPTHPTVWVGLALAVIGLLVAIYAYTGSRVYDIVFAAVAIVGGVVALAGILVAAWGRSIMAARATRSRRTLIAQDAMTVSKPAEEPRGSEEMPTVAAPSSKKAFSFPLPGRIKREEKRKPNDASALLAFKRKAPAPDPVAPSSSVAPSSPASPPEEPLVTLVAKPVKATLKCPQCGTQFTAEGVRPFTATCTSCGFGATV